MTVKWGLSPHASWAVVHTVLYRRALMTVDLLSAIVGVIALAQYSVSTSLE